MSDQQHITEFSPEAVAAVFGAPDGAPATPGAEAPVEETAEAAQTPKEPTASARIIAAKRAEATAAAKRVKEDARERELTARQVAQEAREADQRLFDEDPASWASKRGWGQKELQAHLEKLAGTFKPEALADKKLTANEERVALLEKKLAEKDAADAARAQQANERAAGEAFVSDLMAKADQYPTLLEIFDDESDLVEAAIAHLNQVLGTDSRGRSVTRGQLFAADNGRPPTHDEIAESLEVHARKEAQERLERRSKSAWRKRGDALLGSEPVPGDLNRVPPVKGTSPRTLSARDASLRAAAPTTEWSQEQADLDSLRLLEAMIRKQKG